jgi:predicted nucleic acid-binding protein
VSRSAPLLLVPNRDRFGGEGGTRSPFARHSRRIRLRFTGQREPSVRRFLAGMEEIPVDQRIADRAALLRHELPTLRLPDALIAATALCYGVVLATRNTRDFRRVPGLRLQPRR